MVTPSARGRVLVTGALGYVGSVLSPLLTARGYEVIELDIQPTTPARARAHDFVQIDIRDRAALAPALADIDAVVHLAAIVGHPACDADPDGARSINEDGVDTLLSVLPASTKLIFFSTCSVYGRVPDGTCREDTPIGPLSLYAQTKARAEKWALDFGGVALRPATAFGASPKFRSDLIIHDFILRGLRAEHLNLFEPEAMRSFVHVADLATAAIHAIEHYDALKGKAFNVAASDASVTKAELAAEIATFTSLRVSHIEGKPDPDGRDYRIDCSALADTGFVIARRFPTHLRETVEWIRNEKMPELSP